MDCRAVCVNDGLRGAKTKTKKTLTSLVYPLSIVLIALVSVPSIAQTNTTSFSFPDRGGVSLTTSGASGTLGVGHVRINQSGAVAAGFANFGFRRNNVLVSEATVPAADQVTEGRIYTEIGNGVDTGIAFSNSTAAPVQIGYFFTDAAGAVSGTSVVEVPARGQLVQFLSQAPFNAPSGLIGTFTFFVLRVDPNTKIAAIAIRGFVNERGDFLMTTLPVAPLAAPVAFGGSTLSHFASGGGWSTQVVLLNQTDNVLAGTVTFLNQAGQPSSVEGEGAAGSSFNYRIPAKSAWRLRTSDTGALRVGSVRIGTTVPAADLPASFLIFSYRVGSATVSSAGVPGTRPASATRLFVETSSSAGGGLLQTGVAIANASTTSPVRVSFEMTMLDGSPTGFRGDIDIPAGGQIARFLAEIPGFSALPVPFQGVLRISAASGGSISVVGLRGRYNERAEFLASTIPTVNENDAYFSSVLQYSQFVFPHFADGAGYSTQFVLFSGWNAGATNGTLEFLTSAGEPYPVELRPR
jgi:hypothetical protein